MTDEITLPKVKIVRRPEEGIRLSLGSILLVVLCTMLIIISTFIQIDITHFIIPAGLFKGAQLNQNDFLATYTLIPQIPVVMFVTAFLGRKYGITSLAVYILAGLFFVPVFALGGGLKYVLEYGFGFILAYIPAAFFVGSILKSGFSNRNIFHAAVVGVLTIHIVGILYMLFLASIKGENWGFMSGWIFAQSGLKIVYDIIFSFFAIFIARYARIMLWFYM